MISKVCAMIIVFLLLTVILEVLYFILLPFLLFFFRNKTDLERIKVSSIKESYNILIHAASVGEVNGIKQLVLTLLELNPAYRILITTNTSTGRRTAQSISERIKAVLSPLDIFHLRYWQLSLIQPKLILIAETEIWPTLLYTAKKFRIPVIFINARVSKKTFKSYLLFKHFIRWSGRSVKHICAQTEADRIRFNALFNTFSSKTGNLKYSVEQSDYDPDKLRSEWGYQSQDRIIVFGSSRPGEEQLILEAFDVLKSSIENLKLIIAPRHLERMEELKTQMTGRNVSYYSNRSTTSDIMVIDEMGQLLKAYALCDIAIIGGSFYPFGGHNPLEAAYYGRIIVIGQYYDSCRDPVKKLRSAQAIKISNAENLTEDLKIILFNYEKHQEMGNKARLVIEYNKDSLDKHLEVIAQYMRR